MTSMMTDRVPPHSMDAEQAVLAAMLLDERALVKVAALLDPDAFYHERHRHVFSAALSVHRRGETVDPMTVATELESTGQLAAAGGKEYIGEFLDIVPTTENAASHAGIVREMAGRRTVLQLAVEVSELVYSGSDTRTLAQHLFQSALPLSVDDASRGFRHVKTLLYPVIEAIEARASGAPGLKTGYAAIDSWTNGFRPGELVITAGAEKSGKTALALNIAQRVLEREEGRVGVGFVSAEMTADSLVERILSRRASVTVQQIGSGKLNTDEWSRLSKVAADTASWPLYIDDEAEPTLADVIARSTHLKALHPEIGLIVVDFLQLITAREKNQNDAVELKRVSYGLKGMAKRLGVVVLAPCQVNSKEVEAGKDMRPKLKDIQGSSGMRQAADFIGLCYREGLYQEHSPTADQLEVFFAACRRTPSFHAKLYWHGETMAITDL